MERPGDQDWVSEVFPTAELARMKRLLPPGSARRERARRIAARALDAALEAREAVLGGARALDRAAVSIPSRELLVLGVYAPDGEDDMAAAAAALQASGHRVRFALGAIGGAAPALAERTVAEEMAGGKFANLNRLAAADGLGAAEWVLLLDDDVTLPPRFAERMLAAAETFGFDFAQPAQTWSSDAAWRVTRRRPAIARRTRFVETGPVTLMRRDVFEVVHPFSEEGMGWGQCLHWAALAKHHGWSLGIVDALAVRHERRGTATAYDEAEALEAARGFLDAHEHIGFAEAQEVLASYRSLPVAEGNVA